MGKDMKRTLAGAHPDIAATWHPTLNGDLTPEDVSPSSAKVVWWTCEEGHAYQKTVAQRVRPRGCPYCSNRKVLAGYNDLASRFPDIAKEWHPTRNGDVTPADVAYCTTKKFWWMCDKGHEWEAPADKRTIRGHGCHECSGQAATKGETDLESQYPDIAALLHPCNGIPADRLPAKSNKKLWWICDNGHDHPYQRTAYAQIKAEGKCPYCSNHRVLPGFNDLQHLYPELACEWDYELNDKKPYEVSYSSSYRAHWVCADGHKWASPVNVRTSGDKIRICPECHKTGTSFTEQCLLFYLKELYDGTVEESACLIDGRAYEVDAWLPEKQIAIEYNGTYWHRSKHDKDEEKYELLQHQGIDVLYILEPKGIPVADAPYFMMEKFNIDNIESAIRWVLDELGIDLENADIDISRDKMDIMRSYKTENILRQFAHEHPELLDLWDYEANNPRLLYPYLFDSTSKESVGWKCPACESEWEESVKNMIGSPQCPECGFAPVKPEEGDKGDTDRKAASKFCLGALYPRLTEEWDEKRNFPLTPDICPPQSSETLWWECENGHKWQASPDERVHGKSCPYCAGEPYNVLSYARPDVARYWHPDKNGDLAPDDVTAGSKREVWWICDEGHEYETSVIARCTEGYNCPVCSGQKVIADVNSISALRPDIARLWHPTRNGKLTPDAVSCGSDRKIWWTCDECGNDYEKTPRELCRNESAFCPYCANTKVLPGFNDLATKSPELAKQWDHSKNDKEPDEILYCSADTVHWVCDTCGHEWTASVGARYHRNGQCPSCVSAQNRINAIKSSRAGSRPSYIEYFEEHLDELENVLQQDDGTILKTILSAMQTDEQSLRKLRIYYDKDFADIGEMCGVSPQYAENICKVLGLADISSKQREEEIGSIARINEREMTKDVPDGITDFADWLINGKIVERKPAGELSRESGISKFRIDRASAQLGIGNRRGKTTMQKFGHDRTWFYEQNVDKQRSYSDIAKELGVDNNIVEHIYKELDIPYMGQCRDSL